MNGTLKDIDSLNLINFVQQMVKDWAAGKTQNSSYNKKKDTWKVIFCKLVPRWKARCIVVVSDPGQAFPTKIEKVMGFHCLKCWMFLLKAQGFSCSLNGLHKGLGVNKLQLFKSKIHFFSCKILHFLVIRTLVPEPYIKCRICIETIATTKLPRGNKRASADDKVF